MNPFLSLSYAVLIANTWFLVGLWTWFVIIMASEPFGTPASRCARRMMPGCALLGVVTLGISIHCLYLRWFVVEPKE